MAKWWAVALLLLLVPMSSLFGLLRPMTDDDLEVLPQGMGLFADVWQANFWADVLFVAGTLVVGAACVVLARLAFLHEGTLRFLVLLGVVVVGLALHWAVYAVSWSLALRPYIDNIDDDEGDSGASDKFWKWDWDMAYEDPVLKRDNAWTFTWQWGWPGLSFAGLVVPLSVLLAALGRRVPQSMSAGPV